MSIPELIRKKRDGEELTDDELHSFVTSVTDGTIQDCQLGAMLMAMYIRGMSNIEAANLTKHMAQSGDLLTWDPLWKDLLVDKHSTGGVGDKVPMISGRGLQFTGGTLDKLESIPGFNVVCTFPVLREALEKAGCFIAGATASLAPADKQLYKIRDVTANFKLCNELYVLSNGGLYASDSSQYNQQEDSGRNSFSRNGHKDMNVFSEADFLPSATTDIEVNETHMLTENTYGYTDKTTEKARETIGKAGKTAYEANEVALKLVEDADKEKRRE
ncbi:unnamed protein product, partial [Timema podura]|nr:unnamed protein product [Timema podura]